MKRSCNGEWNRAKLGDYFRIKHGYAFKGEFFADRGPYIVLTPGNFNADGGLKLRGEREKYYVGDVSREFILRSGELLVVMTDLTQNAPILGSPAFVNQSDLFLHNQRLGKIFDLSPELDERFLYYLFNTANVRDQIKATATGATVRHTAPDRIYAVEVDVPSLPTQRRIAAVLSAYDDLIENNTRRIAILEEIARSLYREWFVHFRYPGHEHVPLVDSPLGPVPAGWEIVPLGSIASEWRRSVDPGEVPPDTPYVGLEHIPRRSIAINEWGRAGDVQSTKLKFRSGEILFGKIRPYFHKVSVAPVEGVCSSDAIVIDAGEQRHFALVLACVSSDDFVAHATQTSQGTKMPRANWSVLTKYPVPVPPDPLLCQFNDLVGSVVDQVSNLTMRNRNLRSTRDLLLPKLVSGQHQDRLL